MAYLFQFFSRLELLTEVERDVYVNLKEIFPQFEDDRLLACILSKESLLQKPVLLERCTVELLEVSIYLVPILILFSA